MIKYLRYYIKIANDEILHLHSKESVAENECDAHGTAEMLS